MWENGKIEGSQFLGSVWQPQRTIKLQPKEIEIYDNLINNALCMTPFRTMLKHNTFRDRIQMTADIFEPVVLCFIKEEVRVKAHCSALHRPWMNNFHFQFQLQSRVNLNQGSRFTINSYCHTAKKWRHSKQVNQWDKTFDPTALFKNPNLAVSVRMLKSTWW